MRRAGALALALCMAAVRMASAQTDIDELLQALEAEERTERVESAVPVPTQPVDPGQTVRAAPETDNGGFGQRPRKLSDAARVLRKRFIRHVRDAIGLGGTTTTNDYRYLRRGVGSVERGGRTVTMRACFSRDFRFASLQQEMERTVADLERRFADCGFSPVAVSGNSYLNYIEDVGGLAVFLHAGPHGSSGEDVYTLEVSFALDFLAPNQAEPSPAGPQAEVRRDADFGDRKTVEAMLSSLARSDFIVRKVKYRRQTAGVDLSDGDVTLPAFEESLSCEDQRWKELVFDWEEAAASPVESVRAADVETPTDVEIVGLDVGEERERRYEAMKFMNDFIRPCEDGFGWKEDRPEVPEEQARFVRMVREVSGRTILPADAVPPFETLASMRRRFHEPSKRLSPSVVDWNVPVNAYRYFPYTPDCFSQSPYSSTLFAAFSAACTRESVWNEMCALARDLERRFAFCGFRPQEVEEGGYVNYRPNVGGIVIHLLSCRNGKEPVHLIVLHFSTRLFDWRGGVPSGDWKTERLLRNVLTRGLRDDGSVCAACTRRRLLDYCGSLSGMKGVPARGWFRRAVELPAYERRGEVDGWCSLLRPFFPERTVSCFDEAVLLEDLPMDVGGAAESPDAEVRRCKVADSFYERFIRGSRQAAQSVPDVALCEICRGSSSWK